MSSRDENARALGIDRRSRPWRPTVLVLLAITLLVALVWALVRQGHHDPAYRGKPLALWLQTYGSSSSGRYSREWNEADDAVRNIGRNCIPVLQMSQNDLVAWLAFVGIGSRLTQRASPEVVLLFKKPN